MSTTASTGSTVTAHYRVEGMTCGHCERAVTQEIGAIPGVHEVRVELGSGDVTVCSDRPLSRDEVAAAVDEAGYDLG